jgi:hypothetical protein
MVSRVALSAPMIKCLAMQQRRIWYFALLHVFLVSCSQSHAPEARVSKMGEQVRVGPLIYTVLEAEWRTQFGSETNPKVRYSDYRCRGCKRKRTHGSRPGRRSRGLARTLTAS